MIAFSPLAQGMLTDKYLKGVPEGSRAAKATGYLKVEQLTDERIDKARRLNDLALQRGQTLAQMALAWLLRDRQVTSVLVGASSVQQLQNNIHALSDLSFSEEELQLIETILK